MHLVAGIMKQLLPAFVVASLLALSAVGCASSTDAASESADITSAARMIAGTTEARHERLGGVWNVTGIENDQDLELGIIEFGGGDPAMNGNQLFLSAYGSDHGDGGVFELGINISGFTKAEMVGPATLKITGTHDTIDGADGDIKTGIPFEATVKLSVKDGNVLPNATVTQGGSSEEVALSTDAGVQFMSSIFEVKSQESANGTIVRVFEYGGGDPAMNGDRLMLSVMSFPDETTYDLGLDVSSVDKLTVVGEKEVRIEGREHFMSSNGEIASRPYAYRVDLAFDGNGAPGPVKLTRTK